MRRREHRARSSSRAEPRVDALGQLVGPHGVARRVQLPRAARLQERLAERAADAHRLADRLHLRAERRVGAGELLEREARELDDDVVERRLEARGRRARQVVRDLVERVADRQLRRDLRDRVAGRLRRERGRARDARVHLDHAQLAGLAARARTGCSSRRVSTPTARTTAIGGVAELLVGLVRERHLRRDRHRVAGVDAHRVEVLDRADDDDVVGAVADHLELELVPAAHATPRRAPGRSGSRRARARPGARAPPASATNPPPCPPSVNAGPHDRRKREAVEARPASVTIRDSGTRRPARRTASRKSSRSSARRITSTGAPISSTPSSSRMPSSRSCDGEVERGLAAHRRQQRVGPLAREHVGDAFEVERLEVGAVGEAGVGHDRRRVRVDDDRAEPVLAQHLERLAAGVVELAGLPDHDRPGADQADRLEVRPPGQGAPPRPSSRGSARRRAARARPPGGTARERARSSG